MGDAAEKLAEAIRALMPAPIAPPEWVQLSVEAKRRGMETRNLRAWCLARGVPLKSDGPKVTWVSPAAIDMAIAKLDDAKLPPSRATVDEQTAELDRLIDQGPGRKG